MLQFKDFEVRYLAPVTQYLEIRSERLLAKQQKEIDTRMKFFKECLFTNVKQYKNLQMLYNFENHAYDYVDEYFGYIEQSRVEKLNVSVSEVSFSKEYWDKLYKIISQKNDILTELQFEAVLSQKHEVEDFFKCLESLKNLTKLQFKITTIVQPDDLMVLKLFNQLKEK